MDGSSERAVSRRAEEPVTPGFVFGTPPLTGPPNPRLALERYRELATDYDQRTAAGEPYRGPGTKR